MSDTKRIAKIIDTLILFFFVIFLLSLTNSIFLNQLGYYSALLLSIARYFITKENKFEKTGLEVPLVMFLGIEILSALFSDYSSIAFVNVFKRAILIPIIYVTVISADNINRAKLLFKIYLTVSFITILIYLYFSYQYYISNLYGQKESGPGVFQYPITASEIMSFTVIYFFSFFINEKTNLRNKLLLFTGFAISALAVFATYKRTGWLAIAFGIFVILVVKKQWKIIIPVVLAGLTILFTEKDISNIHIYKTVNGLLKNEQIFETGGRANSVIAIDSNYFVSDFENGLVKYSGFTVVDNIIFPAPVVTFNNWMGNYYYAGLIDTRLVLVKKEGEKFIAGKSFLTKGMVSSSVIVGRNLYVLDSDSGLTIFKNPEDLADTIYLSKFRKYNNFFADSSWFVFYIAPDSVEIYKNSGGLPGKLIQTIGNQSDITSLFYYGKYLFISYKNGFSTYQLFDSIIIKKPEQGSVKNIVKWRIIGDNIYAVDQGKNLYQFTLLSNGTLAVINKYQVAFIPQDFTIKDSTLILLELKRSRLASILDPYHPSNFGRFALWRAGFKMFKDHPLLGVGDIDLRNYFIKYKRDYDKDIQGHMHNNFIHVLVTLGLLGLIIVVFLFVKIIMIDFKIYKYVKDESFISSYALGTIGGFFAFLFAGLTELNFGDHEIITIIWFTFGLNYLFYMLVKKK